MPHIHTGPGQHDFTASAFVVRLDTPEPTLMLHMHKKLNKYMQFGGHVELHETPWQAVVHEIAEESGYDIEQLKILQPEVRLKKITGPGLHPSPLSIQTHPFSNLDHYHTDIQFAFVTDQPPRHTVAAGESDEFKLCTLKELQQLPDDAIYATVRETGIFVLTEVLVNWKPVTLE